jgi:ubiquinone/menaquinone biosynthesis C-methylase UbiE
MEDLIGETLGLPEGSHVLDTGCGFGPAARRLTDKFGLRVTGIDLLGPRLDAAQRLNQQPGTEGIGLARADYHSLPFPEKIFDGLFTLEAAVHADPLEDALAEFYRVLKPNGRLALFECSIPPVCSKAPVMGGMIKRIIKRSAQKSLLRFGPDEIHGLLEATGFIDVEITDISRNVWPTWRFLWHDALEKIRIQRQTGVFSLDSIPATTFAYPGRRLIKYLTINARKPG